ncbi:Serine protease/ABC transporter B family protein tagC [Daldinia childiae]|uniref:Serine protease/ABC transporter B family protein tagC n=1 Tax=Daldinia childiae TaxID=326645 RepID=UPI001447647D|nr:Serine protease/ABC transporter B family protein tagC [Daldinia childiae]KAF3069642.1 Serine protease/ABC transporter B family protein tagC [Daldinia childiae]
MGHVGIFIVEDDKDRPSLIGWRSVSPGSRIEIYSERDVIHQKIHEFALKDLPLFPITINGNKFQPDKNIVGTSSHYILIQSYMPLTLEQEIKLNDLGESEDPKPSLQQYFSKNAYLYRWNSTNLDRIRLLDFVAYANVFPTECKMSRSLQSKLLQRHKPQQVHSSSKKLWGIDIVFHDDVKPKELESSIIEAAHLDSITFEYGLHKLRCKVQERYLGALCKIDDVRIIEEVPRWGLRDNSARTILGIGIHYMELGSMDGKGEIVAVADTGFDKGERDDVHRAFENRVEEICVWPPQNAQNARDARDTNGHGTHVCGLVLGNGLINGDRIQGAAPDARLLVECLGPSLKRKLNSLSELFQHSYDKGARVHNNSWGTIWQGVQYQYNHSAEEIDEFIWENKDMVICIAAGNDGEQQCDSQIGTEASSKNCITSWADCRTSDQTRCGGTGGDGSLDHI